MVSTKNITSRKFLGIKIHDFEIFFAFMANNFG